MIPGFIMLNIISIAFYLANELFQIFGLALITRSLAQILQVLKCSINISRAKVFHDSLMHFLLASAYHILTAGFALPTQYDNNQGYIFVRGTYRLLKP